MFFRNTEELAASQRRIAELEQRLALNEQALAAAQADTATAEELAHQCRQEADELRALFANFQTFGESMIEVQGSLNSLAEKTKTVKDSTVEAQSVSIESRQSVESIANNMSDLANNSQQTAAKVGELDIDEDADEDGMAVPVPAEGSE